VSRDFRIGRDRMYAYASPTDGSFWSGDRARETYGCGVIEPAGRRRSQSTCTRTRPTDFFPFFLFHRVFGMARILSIYIYIYTYTCIYAPAVDRFVNVRRGRRRRHKSNGKGHRRRSARQRLTSRRLIIFIIIVVVVVVVIAVVIIARCCFRRTPYSVYTYIRIHLSACLYTYCSLECSSRQDTFFEKLKKWLVRYI